MQTRYITAAKYQHLLLEQQGEHSATKGLLQCVLRKGSPLSIIIGTKQFHTWYLLARQRISDVAGV